MPIGHDEFVQVGGRRLRVVTQGSGPPLLLITGLGANVEMWGPLMEFMPGRQIIAFDPPGAGRSATGRPYRMKDIADVISGLLDELALEAVDTLGYSWGGAVAQQFAERHPRRVRRLVLAGTTFGVGSFPPAPHVLVHLMHPLRYYSDTYLRWVTPVIYGGRVSRDGRTLGEHTEDRMASPPGARGYATQLMAITGWSSLPWLHRIRAPTLVLGGTEDPIIPVCNTRILSRLIPDARLCLLEGAGHLFLFDDPARAASEVNRFLDEPSASASRPARAT